MYNDFFGFRERPFRLVPDPAYLFLSKSHEEAMAHLVYAISQGEGFAEIIGEAGTGKTILCRAFLEKLNDTAEVAYIFNPKLDSIQLLKAINDEFGIDSKADNIKELIDTLNVFLMEKRTEGKRAVLLIDEAQNLAKEVLEQLRLLSNLETTTANLLQIILVGQPELVELLDSWELRQLGQRITLSCCLRPLTYRETAAYIWHRINIAAQRPGVKFSRAAIRAVYKYSSGIPRLVNIASDRALLLAYGLNRNEIRGREAKAAIKELTRRGNTRSHRHPQERELVFMTSLLLVTVFFFIFYHFKLSDLPALSTPGQVENSWPEQKKTFVIPAQERKEKMVSEPNITNPDSPPKPSEGLTEFLQRLDGRSSRQAALKASLKLWGTEAIIGQPLENVENDKDFFLIAAIQNGFSSLPIENDLELVRRLDKPAIIECYLPGNSDPRYVVISAIEGDKLTLEPAEEKASVEAEVSELKSFWTGSGYILWKNFFGLAATSPFRLSEDSVITLKAVLQEIGFTDIQINSSYDRKTREAIKEIQERHGLITDGILGPLTQIVLYNEIKASEIPHIGKHSKDFYYLQTGSFKVEQNALQLEKTLNELNEKTVIRRVQISNKGLWFIVYVGPFSSWKEADQRSLELRKKGLYLEDWGIHKKTRLITSNFNDKTDTQMEALPKPGKEEKISPPQDTGPAVEKDSAETDIHPADIESLPSQKMNGVRRLPADIDSDDFVSGRERRSEK